ncbi:MAG TPA: response regulator [Thermoanaerobaculia bacterium]|nr:response regulator [Thermoanaerobaculia bacterium]
MARSVDDAVRLVRGAAAVLSRVHGEGMTHGELTPGSLRQDGDEISVRPPQRGARESYAAYASPERLMGKDVTPASDVYSLGAILFEFLTFKPPFEGKSVVELMLKACADPAPNVRSLRIDVPDNVASVIARCLEKDPTKRYANAAELGDALDDVTVRDLWPGRRVLVADDDAPVRDLVARIIRTVGVEADIVASGRDAVQALKARRYDLAFLDLHMPRLSGWEVLDYLRNAPQARPGRLFVVTGFANQTISAADTDLVTAVLYKPVATDEMRSLVEHCLRGDPFDLRNVLRTTKHRAVA